MTPTAPEVLAERVQLLQAIEAWCECTVDEIGSLHTVCAGHTALRSAMFVRHMSFARSLAVRLLAEDFAT